MLEAALPWVPHFVLRGTVPATAKCLLTKKPIRLKNDVGQQLHSPQVLSSGVQTNVMSGDIKAVATIQSAGEKDHERASGLTTSQVHYDVFTASYNIS